MEEQEREQNKRINQHQRLINNLRERHISGNYAQNAWELVAIQLV